MSIGSIRVTSPGWTTQFAHPFPPGLVPAGHGVQLGDVPTQTTVKRTWPDGSAKHVIIKANIPTAGEYPITVIPNPVGSFTPAEWPELWVHFGIGGVTWTAILPDVTLGDTWENGALCRTARVKLTPTDILLAPDPSLRVWCDVSSVAGGHVLDVQVNNILDLPQANLVAYDVRIAVDGTVVFTQLGVTHSNQTRWRWRIPVDITEAVCIHDMALVMASQALPEFSPLTAAPGALLPNGSPASSASPAEIANDFSDPMYGILQYGGMMPNMGEAGWRPEISTPYPDVVARYVIHKDPGSLNQIKKWGDLSGSWSGHLTTADGGWIESTSFWLEPRGMLPNGPAAGNGMTIPGITYFQENAHRPQIVYPAYLLTGDRYYADQLAFWAQSVPLLVWPGEPAWYGSRATGGDNILMGDQIRGVGRGLMTVEDAAAYLPDGHALVPYLTNIVMKNCAFLDADCAFNDGGPFSSPSYWLIKNNPGAFHPDWQHTIPWTDSFVGLMVWKARRHGLTTTEGDTYLARIGTMWKALFSTPGWPLEAAFAAPYSPLLIPAAPGATDFANPYATSPRDYSDDIPAMVAAMGGPGNTSARYADYYGTDARAGLLFGAAMGIDTSAELAYLMAQPGMLEDMAERAGHYVVNVTMGNVVPVPPDPEPEPPDPEPEPPEPQPVPPTCTLNNDIYAAGATTEVILNRKNVSEWTADHPEWHVVSTRPHPKKKNHVILTIECRPA